MNEMLDYIFSEPVEMQLAFDIVAASCHQIIQIVDKDYDEESIIAGLQDGTLATSTWVGEDYTPTVDVVATGETVGIIVSQEIDGEYEDFR
jgi:hypothetical protein